MLRIEKVMNGYFISDVNDGIAQSYVVEGDDPLRVGSAILRLLGTPEKSLTSIPRQTKTPKRTN